MIWLEIKGTKDRISSNYAYIAIFRSVTREGVGVFWTFRAGIKQRTERNALTVGALPTTGLLSERVEKSKKGLKKN